MSQPWMQGTFLPEEPSSAGSGVAPAAAAPIRAPEPAAVPRVPAGWYPDPTDASRRRWWDGASWTPETFAGPAQTAPVETWDGPSLGGAPSVLGTSDHLAAATVWSPQPYVEPEQPARRKVGLLDAIKRGYLGFGDFGSRATLGEYWLFALFLALVYGVGVAALAAGSPANPSAGASSASSGGATAAAGFFIMISFAVLLSMIPMLALTVRRLHDAGFSGWWVLAGWVPFGSIVVLVMCCLPGQPQRNRFGPVPS